MTNSQHLIELLEDTLHEWECDASIKTLTEIAEQLIENGVIVPPCKVGTIVWILRKDRVPDDDYRMNFHDEWVICEVSFQLSMINQIGKTVFLTRKEAEKALKKECESNV